MSKTFDFVKQVFQGKTICRILLNWQVKQYCQNLTGLCVDLAGGKNPSYYRYWDLKGKLVRSDYDKSKNPDLLIDLNKPLVFKDNSVDNIFLFNAIHVVSRPEDLINEIRRTLKPRGKLFIYAHMISVEVPEPHDYHRLTSGRIKMLLEEFNQVEIHKVGERGTASVHLRHDFYKFKLIRFFAFAFGLFLDVLTPEKIKRMHPGPIGYFVIAEK